jgi:hypothetical protein
MVHETAPSTFILRVEYVRNEQTSMLWQTFNPAGLVILGYKAGGMLSFVLDLFALLFLTRQS